MGVLEAVGLFLAGLGLGLLGGWLAASRRSEAQRRQLLQRDAEIRNHVLPLLEHRASGAGVPPERRARDVADPVLASIEIARAIQEIDHRRDLPYSDTMEVSAQEISESMQRRRHG